MQNQLGQRRGHSEACRERMEKAIVNDESTGQERIEKAKARIDDYVARIGEDQMEEERADEQVVDEPIELVMEQARDLEQSERENQDPRPEAN